MHRSFDADFVRRDNPLLEQPIRGYGPRNPLSQYGVLTTVSHAYGEFASEPLLMVRVFPKDYLVTASDAFRSPLGVGSLRSTRCLFLDMGKFIG